MTKNVVKSLILTHKGRCGHFLVDESQKISPYRTKAQVFILPILCEKGRSCTVVWVLFHYYNLTNKTDDFHGGAQGLILCGTKYPRLWLEGNTVGLFFWMSHQLLTVPFSRVCGCQIPSLGPPRSSTTCDAALGSQSDEQFLSLAIKHLNHVWSPTHVSLLGILDLGFCD